MQTLKPLMRERCLIHWKAANYLQLIFKHPMWFSSPLTWSEVAYPLRGTFLSLQKDLWKTGTFSQHPSHPFFRNWVHLDRLDLDRCSCRWAILCISLNGDVTFRRGTEAKGWTALHPSPSHSCIVQSPVFVCKLATSLSLGLHSKAKSNSGLGILLSWSLWPPSGVGWEGCIS